MRAAFQQAEANVKARQRAVVEADEERERVDTTRRGRPITVRCKLGAWIVELGGGGAQPFSAERYTSHARAKIAVTLWKQGQARSTDEYM